MTKNIVPDTTKGWPVPCPLPPKLGQPKGPATIPSTRDPARAGFKAAMLARLRDRIKTEDENSDPGNSGWRRSAIRFVLLKELVAEIEGMKE